MLYLNTFEAFDIKSFNNFIKKNSKTNYISTTDIKRLNNSDLTYKDYQKINDDIDRNIKFIQANDLSILDEILIDVQDEFEFKVKRVQFKLYCADKSYWDSNRTNDIFITKSNSGKLYTSNLIDRFELLPKEEIFNLVVKNICDTREATIQRKHDELTSTDKFRRTMAKLGVKSIANHKLFKKVEIFPILTIRGEFLFRDYDVSLYTRHTDPEEEQERSSFEHEKIRNFTSNMEISISRYLASIGYSDLKFRLYIMRYSYDEDDIIINFELK